MLQRLTIGAALVALLCGALAGDLAVAKPNKRVMTGKTAQGYRIKVVKQGSAKLRLVTFKADLECRDGTILQLDEGGFLPTPVRKGHFRDKQFGDTDTIQMRGRYNGKVVRGWLRLTDKLGKKRIHCVSKWIRFQAS